MTEFEATPQWQGMNRITLIAMTCLATLTACGGGVPAELLGEWSGPATITVNGNDTTMTSNLVVSDGPSGARIVATGILPSGSDSTTSMVCRIDGRPTATGFAIDQGTSWLLEGPAPRCGTVEQNQVVAALDEVTAVRTQTSLTVTGRGTTQICNTMVTFQLRGAYIKR